MPLTTPVHRHDTLSHWALRASDVLSSSSSSLSPYPSAVSGTFSSFFVSISFRPLLLPLPSHTFLVHSRYDYRPPASEGGLGPGEAAAGAPSSYFGFFGSGPGGFDGGLDGDSGEVFGGRPLVFSSPPLAPTLTPPTPCLFQRLQHFDPPLPRDDLAPGVRPAPGLRGVFAEWRHRRGPGRVPLPHNALGRQPGRLRGGGAPGRGAPARLGERLVHGGPGELRHLAARREPGGQGGPRARGPGGGALVQQPPGRRRRRAREPGGARGLARGGL